MLRAVKALYHLFVAVFAVIWYRFPSRWLTVIGVTGTDGKTTTATLIYEILKAAGFRVSKITSVDAVVAGKEYDTGFHVTNPDPFPLQRFLREAVSHGDTHMVLEVTSHGLSQLRVFGVHFAVAVLTNVTHEHLDWHGTYEKYLHTKISLLRRARVAVLNRDDAPVYNKVIPMLGKKNIITYGVHRDAVVTPRTFPFATSLPGEFNRYNCLAAMAACYALGVPKKKMQAAIEAFAGIRGRMEVITTSPFTVIVDFAHTPNAFEQVLRTVKKMTNKRVIHVFGSAGERDATKRPIMGKASSKYADLIILTEEDYRMEDVEKIMDQIAEGIPYGKPVLRLPVRSEAILAGLKAARPGDFVIITGKGHEKSLCRGSREFPWSDQEAVQKALQMLKK